MNLHDGTDSAYNNNNHQGHNDDYEGGKVIKTSAKKMQLDEEVRMVRELDRWG